jgi:hypothetical protein
MNLAESQDIGIDIACPFELANAFLSRPENFVHWASGMGKLVEKQGDVWLVDSPIGMVHVRFTPPNEFGVADHRVIPKGQPPIDIPLRVVRNGEGCHVVLTLFRLSGMSDEQFAKDADWVRRDLGQLRSVLEVPYART